MKYYIYKIENLANHKIYIGLTNNIQRRRNRHFTDLNCQRHPNSFLQKEFNIFGRENFSFEKVFEGDCSYEEISEKERYYIKQYDSYYNGYNQNEGGNFGPSNGGTRFTKSDIFSICAALEFCPYKPGGLLAEMFDTTPTTINRIKHKVNHCHIIEEYEALSEEQRKEIYQIFEESSNFYERKLHKNAVLPLRSLTEEKVHLIWINEEYKILTKNALYLYLGIKNSNVLYGILKGETYKDYTHSYSKLTNGQKEQLVSLLRNQQKETL